MSAPDASHHPEPLGLLPINNYTGKTFTGLIPGLAGCPPTQKPVNAHPQLPTPSSSAPSHESTDERLNRLEAFAVNQAQEIVSLRYSSSASREEAEGLHVRVAELEHSPAGGSTAIRLSPVSIKYNYSAMVSHAKWETLVREKKRSRFATFFEQMAAAPAPSTPTRTVEVEATPVAPVKRSRHAALLKNMAAASAALVDSHVMDTVPVLNSTPSTALTARCGQMVTPPPSNPIHIASYAEVDVYDDPYPWGGRFGQPDFDFAALIPAGPQRHKMGFYVWFSAPHGQEMEHDADPFPWGRRFPKQPEFNFAALVKPSITVEAPGHGKEMQACSALHAPRPVRPRAPLLNRVDF